MQGHAFFAREPERKRSAPLRISIASGRVAPGLSERHPDAFSPASDTVPVVLRITRCCASATVPQKSRPCRTLVRRKLPVPHREVKSILHSTSTCCLSIMYKALFVHHLNTTEPPRFHPSCTISGAAAFAKALFSALLKCPVRCIRAHLHESAPNKSPV
jgi:hypothetical protein